MVILVGIIGVIIIVSMITERWDELGSKNVYVQRYFDKKRVKINDDIVMTTEVINKKWLPLPWVLIQARVPKTFAFKRSKIAPRLEDEDMQYSMVTSLLFFEKVKRHDVFQCTHRGYYSLYDLDIVIGDYFGFKKAIKKVKQPVYLMVYPEIIPLKKLVIPLNSLMGDVSVKRWISPDPLLPLGTRGYTTSDSFNAIDWKATARHGHLQVKLYDYTADPAIMVFVDVQAHDVYWQGSNASAVEKNVMIAASIIEDALIAKIPVGLCHNALDMLGKIGTVIEPAANDKQRELLLDGLTLVTAHRGCDMGELIRKRASSIGKETVLVCIVCFLTEGMLLTLNKLAIERYHIKIFFTTTIEPHKLHRLNDRIEQLSWKGRESF